MGNNRPVKTKDWVAFLKAHDCKYLRTKASHDHYKCPGCIRTITHREKDKDIPSLHLRTNLFSMGLTIDYLYKWIDENC
jgi:predicted RNA binding protein YcfA (HicA-like mRNA interferase family)